MSWATLKGRREELLHTLAPPILSGLGNEDTPSPIFHGCLDWHSAVHGVYSLYAIHRRTGAELYLEAARQHARPELVEAEVEHMRDEELEAQENPYGFSWVLALVRAQELATGTHELRPLADYARERVVAFVTELDAERGFELATCDAHPNLSWAVIHLALWARYVGDETLLELAREAARRHLQGARLDDALPIAMDAGDADEFMAPALMRLAALGAVLGDDVRDRLPPRFDVQPLETPTTVHARGVGFFRAFALLHLHRATGLSRLRENAARLVLRQVARTDLWRSGDYDHRHWVAQIGVRVIDDSYDE
jgi:Protein of unknown function (DUF2891)